MKYLVDIIIVSFLLLSFPVAMLIFGKKRVTIKGVIEMLVKYEYHFYLLIFIFILKSFILYLETPVENIFSMNFTQMIHDVEGNKVLWIQRGLYHPWMTVSMVAIYVGSFMFIYTFSLALLAYLNRFKQACNLIFLYLIMLILSIPFYLFVIVYVPSYPKMFYPGAQSVVMGVEPLAYNFGPHINDFFTNYDTFNNCFPSMHVAYPTAIFLLFVRHAKRDFLGYKLFLFIMIILITISILYLGIHWVLDIFGGVAIAVAGIVLTERYSYRFWKRTYKTIHKIERFRARKGLNITTRFGKSPP
jgi:membrane-associated phospholipid phosphatase